MGTPNRATHAVAAGMDRALVTVPLRLLWVTVAAVSLLLAFHARRATADITFGTEGSGAGQLNGSRGIAVDRSSGRLYVADKFNRRIDVFDSGGTFLFAFGWGVADGSSAELQTCTTTCFAGIGKAQGGGLLAPGGGGAGQFAAPERVAVDDNPASPAFHDVYVFDGARVQQFAPTGEFLRAWGGGVITAGARGKGSLVSGSAAVTSVIQTEKHFEVGQVVTGAGIPANTKIVEIGEGSLTLSKASTATANGVTLSVAEGPGNVPVNEQQTMTVQQGAISTTGQVRFTAEVPNPGTSESGLISTSAPASGPGSVQEALEGLANIGAGNVRVTGPAGGPYTIEFVGRLADTDVRQIEPFGVPAFTVTTLRNGHSAPEVCTAAVAASCSSGHDGPLAGAFVSDSDQLAVGGSSGTIYVLDRNFSATPRIEEFNPNGSFLSEVGPLEAPAIAGAASGDFYLSGSRPGVVAVKYDPAGNVLAEIDDPGAQGSPGFLALDTSDDLFTTQLEAGEQSLLAIVEYDSAGNPLRAFGYGSLQQANGIAAFSTPGGDVYASEENRIHQLTAPPPGPVVLQGNASQVGNAQATLNAYLNPEGGETTYHFEYVTQKGYEEQGNSFIGTATKETAAVSVAPDIHLHHASAVVEIAPETAYRFRLVASNRDGARQTPGAAFTTLPPLEIGETWASDVSADAATVTAQVNPLGIPTHGYFEYVDDESFQRSGFAEAKKSPDVDAGQAPLDFGEGEAMQGRSARIVALEPDTGYRYRIVAFDKFVSVTGPTKAFATTTIPSPSDTNCVNQAYRTGASAALADCRAYEMVSPVDKQNGDVSVIPVIYGSPAQFDRSSSSGDRFTYSSYRAFGGAVSAPYSSQYLASRDGATGWSSKAISPPGGDTTLGLGFDDVEYRSFSEDLCEGWLVHLYSPVLAAGAPEGFPDLYRRSICAGGGYEALSTVAPPHSSVEYRLALQAVSRDGRCTLFRANDSLTSGAPYVPGVNPAQPYESCGGTLQLVSVLPNGLPYEGGASVGVGDPSEFRFETVNGAVSEDGSRVYWTASAVGSGKLYLRINANQPQSRVSGGSCAEAAKACTYLVSGAEDSRFLAANRTGEDALFSVAGNGQTDLKEYDFKQKKSTLIAHGLLGVPLGTSEDLSRIYFVSQAALAPGAEEGQPNLYLDEEGDFTFIGALSYQETHQVGPTSYPTATNSEPVEHMASATPDGGHLTFVSNAQLTGYDNTDVASGEPDLEVYLYNASSAGGQLVCVSCNPTGARPVGRLAGGTNDGNLGPHWAAARIAPWANDLYDPHVISSDGSHLFFESFDALVPRDTNGVGDVYEWEPASSKQACEGIGGELYVQSAAGCISLISSGESSSDSRFLDASVDGRDAFFTTAASLVPQDGGLLDVYDARAGGGIPVPPAPPAVCEGEACQGAPSPPIDSTPASLVFEGAGNVRESVSVTRHRAKRPNKKHKKQHKKRHKRRRHSAHRSSVAQAGRSGR